MFTAASPYLPSRPLSQQRGLASILRSILLRSTLLHFEGLAVALASALAVVMLQLYSPAIKGRTNPVPSSRYLDRVLSPWTSVILAIPGANPGAPLPSRLIGVGCFIGFGYSLRSWAYCAPHAPLALCSVLMDKENISPNAQGHTGPDTQGLTGQGAPMAQLPLATFDLGSLSSASVPHVRLY